MKRWKFSEGQCAYAFDACKEQDAHLGGSDRDPSRVFVP